MTFFVRCISLTLVICTCQQIPVTDQCYKPKVKNGFFRQVKIDHMNRIAYLYYISLIFNNPLDFNSASFYRRIFTRELILFL